MGETELQPKVFKCNRFITERASLTDSHRMKQVPMNAPARQGRGFINVPQQLRLLVRFFREEEEIRVAFLC